MIVDKNIYISRKFIIILAVCLFTSVDTIMFGTNCNTVMILVPRLMAIVGSVMICNLQSVDKKQFLCLLIFLLITIFSFLINDTDINTGISKILFILLGFSIATRFSIKSFFYVFDKVLFIVACSSMILEILAYSLPVLCSHFFCITNDAGTIYYSIIISSVNSNYLNNLLIRSSGIYWEAGAFAIYLLLGLIAQLFIFEEANIKKVILYLVCIIFTFSTTGIIAVNVLMITFLISKQGFKLKDRRLRYLIAIVIVVFTIFFILGEQNEVYNTLFGKIIDNSSTTRTRIASLIIPFEIAKDHPLVGVSPKRISECMIQYALTSKLDLQASSMCTNTLTYQFATYGFIYGVIFFIRNWIFCKRVAKEKIVLAVGIMIVLVLAYCGENFYSFLPYVFVFMSYEKKKERYKYHENCCY